MKSMEQIKNEQKEQLFKLLAWVGSQARLSKELNVSQQVVSSWVARGRISATAAMLVDDKTKGLFKKEDLRPDVINWE